MIIKGTLRVLGALTVGLVVAVWLAGKNPRVHQALESYLRPKLQSMLGCQLDGTIASINLFGPSVVIHNVGASAPDPNDWQWKAQSCTLSISYLELLVKRSVSIGVHLDGVEASSLYDNGNLPISNHLANLVSVPEDVPVGLKKLLVTNAKFTVYTKEHDKQIQLKVKTEASTVGTQFRVTAYITDGALTLANRDVAQGLVGTLTAQISRDPQLPGVSVHTDLGLLLNQLPPDQQQCTLHAAWQNGKGSLTLSNKLGTCAINQADIIVTPEGALNATLAAHIPLSYMAQLAAGNQPAYDVSGVCSVQASLHNIATNEQFVKGTIVLDDCSYKKINIHNITANVASTYPVWNIDFKAEDPLFESIQGTAEVNTQKNEATLSLENGSALAYAPLKYWQIPANGIHLDMHMNAQKELSGSLRATAHHEKLGTTAAIHGTVHVDADKMGIKGTVNDKPYVIEVSLKPHILLKKMFITDQKGESLIAIKPGIKDPLYLDGAISFPFLRTLVMSGLGYDVRGQGDINIKTALKGDKLYAQLQLPKGNVRLGNTYNYIQDAVLPLEIDLANKRCVLRHAQVKLHKGSVHCERATIHYNESGQITFAHVPLVFNKLFLNVGKDMFAVLSGYVVLTYRKDHVPFIKGTLSVERAQVKQNILSGSVQGSVLKDFMSSLLGTSSDIAFDMRLINRNPLQVRTNVLHTDLDLMLRCTGSITAPRVEGSINFLHGKLQFPYKPLNIVQGMLYFEPHQPDEPRIELTAKGVIKRYTVSMQVGGTILAPTFSFSSSPSLDEEQIITLLLAGSEAGSLSLVMPSLIMQNVQNYIFGTDHGSSTVETYVNNVLAPFKHIRIVPSFSDQTARGGFRGAIEIDVSERLHATIQKNFSLTEDTRVELEFRVSDDINVRGIKDERGDLGGELETRVSF